MIGIGDVPSIEGNNGVSDDCMDVKQSLIVSSGSRMQATAPLPTTVQGVMRRLEGTKTLAQLLEALREVVG